MPGRIRNLLIEFAAIRDALAQVFDGLSLELPEPAIIKSLSALKRYEDALVCSWVGVEYRAGRTVTLGGDDAAIWCPEDVVRVRDEAQLTGRSRP